MVKGDEGPTRGCWSIYKNCGIFFTFSFDSQTCRSTPDQFYPCVLTFRVFCRNIAIGDEYRCFDGEM